MKSLRVGITGATSAVGAIVLEALRDLPGSSVFAFGRRQVEDGSVGFIRWKLGESLSSTDFDYFFHLAFDRRALNFSHLGTVSIARQIQAESPGCRQVLFSSISAFSATKSRYGTAKYLLEKDLVALVGNLTIVRPGLLLERDGMGSGFLKAIEYSPVLPKNIQLLNVRTVSPEQLFAVVWEITTQQTSKTELNVCSAQPLSDEDLFRLRRLPLWSVNMGMFMRWVQIAQRLLPPRSVLRDQLYGMLENRDSPHR